jgi:acetate kinase
MGLELIISKLSDLDIGVIKNIGDIGAIGHRVVNIGDRVLEHSVIDSEIMGFLKECVNLAPLHNPPNLLGIEVCMDIFGSTPNVAVFDNLFHKNMPPEAYLYGLPYEYYKKYRIRKYGFHGIAYTYMISSIEDLMQKNISESKVIAIMLGGGSSISAVKSGSSIDTSMGFTPAEGLIMSTRCGDIDPAIIPFIMKSNALNADEADDIINKKSGILGLSGKYSNHKDLQEGYLEGDEDCIRAFNSYVYRIKKYIGAYAAAMNGLDAIVFGGGIGENSAITRGSILSEMDFLGIRLDESRNNDLNREGLISSDESKVLIYVVHLDEESVIAGETFKIVSKF